MTVDLASRALGGCVVAANDDLFADRRHLIEPAAPVWQPGTYGRDGKIYDGWETRRRREEGHDHAIVRLGAPGVVREVVVDTAFFRGNYPPFASVEALAADGYPSVAELAAAEWTTIVPRSPLKGDAANPFSVSDDRRWTHVRLSIYPDGGVARLRVLGDVVPDPRLLTGTVDLVALQHGGTVQDCSDMFYSPPTNLLLPGTAATIADGWETARRRDDGNDWILFALGVPGRPRRAEIDTTHFWGNAPGWAGLSGVDARAHSLDDQGGWHELLPRTRLQPDTRHLFPLDGAGAPAPVVTHVRLDVYPDGGMSRFRLHGEAADSRLF
jgi:allantoicase